MLVGASSAFARARRVINSASFQRYSIRHARDPVDGGTSANAANGSRLVDHRAVTADDAVFVDVAVRDGLRHRLPRCPSV